MNICILDNYMNMLKHAYMMVMRRMMMMKSTRTY